MSAVDHSTLCAAMVVVGYPPAYSGAGAQAAKLAGALAEKGVRVDVLCPSPPDGDAPACERNGSLHVWRFPSPAADRRRLLLGVRAAWWLLVRSHWQVLHLHGFNYWSLLPCLVAWAKGRPVLVKTTLLGQGADGALRGDLSAPQRLIAAAYRRVDAIVALSDALADSFREAEGYGAEIVRIPNGVDTDAFRPARGDERARARERFDLPQQSQVVVAAGRLEARKNVVALVRAAGMVATRPLCVALIGPPSPEPRDRSDLDAAVAALPAGVEVRFLGELPPSELPEALRAGDILALPSRAEGMPNSLLEGMATGLGCIASDIPGSHDVLANGGGLLVPLDDDAALASGLEAWLSEQSECARAGVAARGIVEARYSLESVAARYVDLYTKLVSGN